MRCIVPLAGPDLSHAAYRFRPWAPVRGRRLLEEALETRAWKSRLTSGDHVFVTRSVDGVEDLETWLRMRWPGCAVVRLSTLTGGALMSSLAGLAQLPVDGEPIIVDLADILFEADIGLPEAAIVEGVGAVVPCFRSQEACYSYLRSEGGRIVEAAEKRVISDRASAGVYIFRDAAIFLEAAAHSIRHRDALSVRGVLFICPAINGVLAAGHEVVAPWIDPVEPVSKAFHGSGRI